MEVLLDCAAKEALGGGQMEHVAVIISPFLNQPRCSLGGGRGESVREPDILLTQQAQGHWTLPGLRRTLETHALSSPSC